MEARFAARRELQQALLSWLDAAGKHPGIARASVYEDVVSPGVFALQAEMATSSALDQHVRSDAFSTLVGAITVLADHAHMSIDKLLLEVEPGGLGQIQLGLIGDQLAGQTEER